MYRKNRGSGHVPEVPSGFKGPPVTVSTAVKRFDGKKKLCAVHDLRKRAEDNRSAVEMGLRAREKASQRSIR